MSSRRLGGCLFVVWQLMRKHMQNTVSESFEILVSVSISFKNLDFVVTSFGKAVGNRRRKRINNTGVPISHCLSTLFKLRYITVFCVFDPFFHSDFRRFRIFASNDLKELFFIPVSSAYVHRIIKHNIDFLFLILFQTVKTFYQQRFRSFKIFTKLRT